MTRRSLAAGIALLCLLSACAQSSKQSGDQRSKPPSRADLKKIVLRSTDLPRGWKGTRDVSATTKEDAAFDAALARCLHVNTVDAPALATADSANFQLGLAIISSWAGSYAAQHTVDRDLAVVRSPRLGPCLSRAAAKQPGVASSTFRFAPGSAEWPDNVVATGRGTITFRERGKKIVVYLRFAFITGPRLEADVDAFSVGRPFPEAVLVRAVEAVARRAAKL